MRQSTKPPVSAAKPNGFDWPLAYEAENLLRQHIGAFLERNAFARQLAQRMQDETGTDFFEWVDHLVVSPDDEPALCAGGFVRDAKAETPHGEAVLEHPRATLPRVLLRQGKQSPSVVAIKPEFIADFMARNPPLTPPPPSPAASARPRRNDVMAGRRGTAEPEGAPHSRYRRVLVAEENDMRLEAVERRAYRGFVPAKLKRGELEAIVKAKELFQTRPRFCFKDTAGVAIANRTLSQAVQLVGRDVACHLFFEEERAYWQSRNRAGRLQKFRQDALGLGWGNHDHHTFRCSRQHFVDLIRFLDKLGFQKRERFYAGSEAGWGAQISEQPVAGIVVFADVDLSPDETEVDFSVKKLPPATSLGTVGLWVGLHGESFLEAGMHHLEARFDFVSLRDQLQRQGVTMMKPFSDFEFLRQAFTDGERWRVRRERAERLVAAGVITREQGEQFVRDGAIGSHLENLQRHGGFKGFNQKAVSVIISATDPRKQQLSHVARAA